MHLHLTTQRLILKPHTQENLGWMNRLDNDPDEQYFNGDDPPRDTPKTLADTGRLMERILNRLEEAGYIDYAIHRREDELLIGCGNIAFIDPYNRRCDLGITMGYDKSNWGKGFAREALQAVIAYCFNELNMNRIGAEIYEFNARSIRLFEGLGFCFEGKRRQSIFKKGMFQDELLYSLLKENWI